MKKLLLGLGLITCLSIPAFSANALLPPKSPDSVDTSKVIPIDKSKVIFAPEIKPVLEPITEPQVVIPYVPIEIPDIVIPPELLKGPTISDIKIASNDNSVLIEWSTSRTATSKVEYGPTSNYKKSLEDKELKTEHAMAIPASVGEIHIRISSNDSLNRHSETQDLTILIPEPAAPTLVDEDTTTSTANEENTGSVEIATTTQQNNNDTKTDIKPLLEINGVDAPKKEDGGLSATNAILGGLALLLAGVLIGVLVKTSKKQ